MFPPIFIHLWFNTSVTLNYKLIEDYFKKLIINGNNSIKSVISAFSIHDQGASSLVYAPQHQLIISAGKKGDVAIVDVRQRQVRHRFIAHESPIKCLAMDPGEEYFITGSADGDIKVTIIV